MLTFSCAKPRAALRPVARAGVAVTLPVMVSLLAPVSTWTSAYAGGSLSGGCVGDWTSVDCGAQWGPPTNPFVRVVPQPMDPAEQARAIARDHRWLARCRPIVIQDNYGVARYHYAAQGCEFGVGEF